MHYGRGGWTFHAKGVWLWAPEAVARDEASCKSASEGEGSAGSDGGGGRRRRSGHDPFATLVGSSNLSERSAHRDLEVCAWMVATAPHVQRQLGDEQAQLRAWAEDAGDEAVRPVPWAARLGAWLLHSFF